ncbi:hypothetical protein Pyn_06455 [Prunus yedoensis var. nudiflora]|uniref:Uncharacterized protein n=1 Tax=Prunus yedoensis var. nudiflora TaxID=2094558 RepID=A0A314UP91_PRUYE|nr:hypothetical protein Pyn_06455 [Prunus yedoensis var. nudiflora]
MAKSSLLYNQREQIFQLKFSSISVMSPGLIMSGKNQLARDWQSAFQSDLTLSSSENIQVTHMFIIARAKSIRKLDPHRLKHKLSPIRLSSH